MIEPTIPTPQEVLVGMGGEHPELPSSTIWFWALLITAAKPRNQQSRIHIQPGLYLDELKALETAGLVAMTRRGVGDKRSVWIDSSSSWATLYLQAVEDLERL